MYFEQTTERAFNKQKKERKKYILYYLIDIL